MCLERKDHVNVKSGGLHSALAPLPNPATHSVGQEFQRSEQRVGVGTHDRGQSRGSGWAHTTEARAEGRGGQTRQRSEQRVGVGTHDRGQSRGSGWAHTSEKKSLDLTPLVPHGNTFIEYLGNSADKGDGKLRQTSPGHLCTCLCELGARSGQSWCGAHPE